MTQVEKALIQNIIGVDPNLAMFLDKYRDVQALALGGVLEILRDPRLIGWKIDPFELLSADDDPLDLEAAQFLSPYRDELVGLGWEEKYRISFLGQRTSREDSIQLIFTQTSYEVGSGFHRGLLKALESDESTLWSMRKRLIDQILKLGNYSVPGVAVVHAIVVTMDNYLILCQRSPHTGYRPSCWSISFEEQITEQDLTYGSNVLSAAAIRGVQEEFASGNELVVDQIKTIGSFLEYDILNIGFCVYIEIPLSFSELKENWEERAKDKWEAVALVGEQFTLEKAVQLLCSKYYDGNQKNKNKFHPSSKYRLFLAANARFGSENVNAALLKNLRNSE